LRYLLKKLQTAIFLTVGHLMTASITNIEAMRQKVEAMAAAEQAEIETLKPVADETTPDDRFIRKCLYNNERGDGLLFAKLHRSKFLYVKRTASWLCWNGINWELDTRHLATAAVEEVAAAYYQRKKTLDASIERDVAAGKTADEKESAECKAIMRRIDRLRSTRGAVNTLDWAHKIGVDSLAIVGDEVDSKPWLLPCKNGVIDLRTGFLQQGRPSDYLITSVPTALSDVSHYLNTGENSPCPRWEKFIDEIHGNDAEISRFIQKWIGYNATGLTTEHFIGVFVGAGRNGKGTMFETLRSVLGNFAWAIQPDMLLENKNARSTAGPSADLMSLFGKRFIIASETDEGKRISGARVKWLTGGDTITARSPHDRFEINFKPTHKLNLYTNHIPKGLTKDFALQQRLLFIDYPIRYVDDVDAEQRKDHANKHLYKPKDKALMDDLKKERDGILAWIVRGCLLWQSEGLNPPASIRANVEQLQKDEDYFGQFFIDCCDDDDKSWTIYQKELYAYFEKWFHENKDECQPSKWGCTRQKLSDWLESKGYEREKRGGQMIVHGVRIKPEVNFE